MSGPGLVPCGREPALVAADRRRRHVGRFGRQVTEGDAALGEIVRGHFEGDLVAGDDPDMVFLELAARVGDKVVTVFEGDAIATVRQHFGNAALHFDEFFFGHIGAPGGWSGSVPWWGVPAMARHRLGGPGFAATFKVYRDSMSARRSAGRR